MQDDNFCSENFGLFGCACEELGALLRLLGGQNHLVLPAAFLKVIMKFSALNKFVQEGGR